ncbi:hypothetical protein IW146_007792 [Coemansia sp. RSA 922]|nr:hypothetical protein IW146_007792 [Coemansia sp. RSA 922]
MSTANGQYPGKLSLSIPGSLDANHMLLDIATDLKKEYIMDTDEDGSPTGYTGGEGSPDPSSDPYNKKRHRLRPEQTRRLLEIFEKTSKPDSEMRKVLGKQLDMTPRTVQIWFQNRRAKIKREGASVGSLRNAGLVPAGPMQGRNRLTFNRAFINRRPTGRVASDGFEHMQGFSGFDSHAQSALHGLPLQNPSQVSIPMDIQRQQQQFTMQHLSSAPSHGFGNSAIGIPIAEHTTYNRSAPVTAHPSQSMSSMDSMLGNMLPIDLHGSQQFLHQSHAYHAVPPYVFAPSHTMPVNNSHMQPLPLNIRNHQASRTRAITADSQTLAHMSRLADPSFNDSMADYASGFRPMLDLGPHQPRYTQGDELLPAHGNSPNISPTEDISVDALLASRRRRLEDARTIARTNAQRGKHVSSDMTLGLMPANGESIPPLGVNGVPVESGAPPSLKKATTATMPPPSSNMMLQPHMYHASNGNSALQQFASNTSHSEHACVTANGSDHSGVPLVPGVSSSEANMLLSTGINTFSLEHCQILDNILSQCDAMNIFQSVSGQDQVLKDSGVALDATNSSDGLGDLGDQLFNTGSSSPSSFAPAQPESTLVDLSAHHASRLAEESKIASTLFAGSIGLLTKRVRSPHRNGEAAQNCIANTVPSTSPSANGEPEPNTMRASSFSLTQSNVAVFPVDSVQYGPSLANNCYGPIANPAAATAKYQTNGANIVSVAANGQAGQRDLTIEQLHQYSSM